MATRWTLRWLGWVPIVMVFNKHIYSLQLVTGRSMQPTLNPDSSSWRDVALFDRTVVSTGFKCKRGDIVAFRSPIMPNTLLVKRIIALEGDVVQTLPPCPELEVVVSQGYVWVEGDERFYSQDSNHFGPVPLALIEARLAFIVWPLSRFGHLRDSPSGVGPLVPLYSSAWRENHDKLAREYWRVARVRTAHEIKGSPESCNMNV